MPTTQRGPLSRRGVGRLGVPKWGHGGCIPPANTCPLPDWNDFFSQVIKNATKPLTYSKVGAVVNSDGVTTRCYNAVLQHQYRCYNGVTTVLQRCYNGVTMGRTVIGYA